MVLKGSVPNEEEKSNETNDREMLASESKRKNNESENWQLLKQTAGAFPLAVKIMTPELHTHALVELVYEAGEGGQNPVPRT